MNGKQEERTVAGVAMAYWYFEARGRTGVRSEIKRG